MSAYKKVIYYLELFKKVSSYNILYFIDIFLDISVSLVPSIMLSVCKALEK